MYKKLLEIQRKYPELTFQNDGYQYINKTKLSDVALKKFDIVTSILKEEIDGFVEFNNFYITLNGDICIRMQVKYSDSFTGDEYLKIN